MTRDELAGFSSDRFRRLGFTGRGATLRLIGEVPPQVVGRTATLDLHRVAVDPTHA